MDIFANDGVGHQIQTGVGGNDMTDQSLHRSIGHPHCPAIIPIPARQPPIPTSHIRSYAHGVHMESKKAEN